MNINIDHFGRYPRAVNSSRVFGTDMHRNYVGCTLFDCGPIDLAERPWTRLRCRDLGDFSVAHLCPEIIGGEVNSFAIFHTVDSDEDGSDTDPELSGEFWR